MNLLTKKKTIMKKPSSFVSVKQRIVASFTAVVMLLQICLPTVVWAASLLSNESITVAMTAPRFEQSASNAYLYQQASFDDASYIGSQNITSFRERLVAEKINLGQPTFVPIASDITIFIPTYPTGKLIGDAYVQSRYIRQQVFDLLGRHLIYAASSNISEVAQINQLYEAAFIFAKANPSINFGDNLDAATLAGLTIDMIWPERRVINNESVVVPIVYLKTSTINANKVTTNTTEFWGNAVNLGSITLDHAQLTLGANTIVNTTGNLTATKEALIASGGDINLVVGGTLNLIGSKITGVKDVKIIANEVNVKTVLVPFQDRYGSGTKLGSIASINSTSGSISVRSNGNISFEGSSATASNGSITLNAANNISIKPVFTSYQRTYQAGAWQVSASSLDVVGSRLSAQEKIKLVASGAIHITASDLVSTKGGIEILAGLGIYIADEQGNFQSNRVDKMGKTTGTGSDFESFAIRTVLSAGKEILLATTSGDVELKGAKITSTEGTQVKATNGKVRLLVTKENSQHYLDTVRKGTWTIKTVHEEYLKETGIPNAIVGGLAVEALAGVDIEYAGREGATLAEQMAEYKKMPDTMWMADIYEGRTLFKNPQGNLVPLNQVVDFAKVDLAYKYVREHNTNLSPAAMAIIAICVAVAMGPAGANFIGSGGSIPGFGLISAPAMQAGALTLATSAAQNLAAGKSLEDTLKVITSDQGLKNLAISMVTAGAIDALGGKLELFKEIDGVTNAASLGNQAIQAVANSVVTAGVSVTINGGNSDDYKKAFTQSLATNAINTIGQNLTNKISKSTSLNEASKYIAHAAMGCLTQGLAAKLSDADFKDACPSGAAGAVIAQVAVDLLESRATEAGGQILNAPDKITPTNVGSTLGYLGANGVDLSKFLAGIIAFAAGGDVNAAASGAGMTAQSYRENLNQIAQLGNLMNAMGMIGCDSANFVQCNANVAQSRLRNVLKTEGKYSNQEIETEIQRQDSLGIFTAAAKFNKAFLQDVVLNNMAGRNVNGVGSIDEILILGTKYSELQEAIRDYTGGVHKGVETGSAIAGDAIKKLLDDPIYALLKQTVSFIAAKGAAIVKAIPGAEAALQAQADFEVAMGVGSLSYVLGTTYDFLKEEVNNPLNKNEIEAHSAKGISWIGTRAIGLATAGAGTVFIVTKYVRPGKDRFEGDGKLIKQRTSEDANAELIAKNRASAETPPFKAGTVVLDRDFSPGERLYMYMDQVQLDKLLNPTDSGGLGGWGTSNKFSSQIEALDKLAIDAKWKPNGVPKSVEFEVVKPFRTLDGIAGPQGSLAGGAQQYFLDLPTVGAKEFLRIVDVTTLP